MIIRTIDNVFVNLDNVTRIKFDFNRRAYFPIVITHPVKMEEDDYYYDFDDVLMDMPYEPDGLNKIMDMFIEALEKNEPYFDFRKAYLSTLQGMDREEAAEDISRTYGGKCD